MVAFGIAPIIKDVHSTGNSESFAEVMLILALVSVLAVSSMESTMRDQQIAGVQMRDRVAFQASCSRASASM